jgi:hypothetical protein
MVTGLPPVDATIAPALPSAPPAVVERVASGWPAPVIVPTLCVVEASDVVIGVIAVLSCCVTCSTGPLDSAPPSVDPAFPIEVPSVATPPPTAERRQRCERPAAEAGHEISRIRDRGADLAERRPRTGERRADWVCGAAELAETLRNAIAEGGHRTAHVLHHGTGVLYRL